MTKRYLFSSAKKSVASFADLFSPVVPQPAHAHVMEFSPEACDQIQAEVKDKGILNYYFYFDPNPDDKKLKFTWHLETVYVASADAERWREIGYLIDENLMTGHPTLYARQYVDKYRDVMLVYDNSEIDPILVPSGFEDLLQFEEGGQEINPVPYVNSMTSEVGRMSISSCNVGGLPQHVFFPFPEQNRDLHLKEQWLSSSRDLKEEQFIGYEFKDDTYRLKSVTLICRTGSHEQPGLSGPTPKVYRIEGLTTEGEWEAITSDLTAKKTDWQLFTPIFIDLHPHEAENKTHYKGFRVRILQWNPGIKPDMLTGLMRVKFMCYSTEKVRMPFYPVPHEHVVYAQFNPVLLDTAPATIYPPRPVLEPAPKEEREPIQTTIVDTTDHATTDAKLAVTDGYGHMPSVLVEHHPCPRVEWVSESRIDLDTYDYGRSQFGKLEYDTIIFINIGESDLWIKASETRPIVIRTATGNVHLPAIGVGAGDMVYIHPTDEKYFAYYAGPSKID